LIYKFLNTERGSLRSYNTFLFGFLHIGRLNGNGGGGPIGECGFTNFPASDITYFWISLLVGTSFGKFLGVVGLTLGL